jgi:hypothetical protein
MGSITGTVRGNTGNVKVRVWEDRYDSTCKPILAATDPPPPECVHPIRSNVILTQPNVSRIL